MSGIFSQAQPKLKPHPASLGTKFGRGELGVGQGYDAFQNRATLFDSFQLNRTETTPQTQGATGYFKTLTSPGLTKTLSKNLQGSGETLQQRLSMYQKLAGVLSREGLEHFKNLYNEGVLTDTSADNNHSTLFHLHSVLTTPRTRGVNNMTVLNELVRILNKPYLISQKFPTLAENYGKEILVARNAHTLNRANEPAPLKSLTRADLKVDFSSDCVPASVMYYMAEKKPSELARHINELTSPMEAFYEKVLTKEIAPDKPEEALEVLKYYDIPYVKNSAEELMVRVDLPVAAKFRMINDSQKKGAAGARTGIETAYQSALAYLPTRSYDPATGNRDAIEATVATLFQLKSLTDKEKEELGGILQSSKSPAKTLKPFMEKLAKVEHKLSHEERMMLQQALHSPSKGLTEMEKTLLETIIKDNGGVSSVTFQVVAGKANPGQGEEIQSFLYGYTRPYEQTTADMMAALKMGEFVIIGITDTDHTGAIVGGHEITLTGAFVDKKGEIQFVVVDSDDDIPTPVVRSAREIIPRIHHAGMPNALAKKINEELAQVEGYFIPGKEDEAHFTNMSRLDEPLPAEMLGIPPTPEASAPESSGKVEDPKAITPQVKPESPKALNPVSKPIQSQPVQTQPQVDYVPVVIQPGQYGYPAGYSYGYPSSYPMPSAPYGYGYPYQQPAVYQNSWQQMPPTGYWNSPQTQGVYPYAWGYPTQQPQYSQRAA